jgi:glycosyltransferase involved in cell wall biosynthesis
MSVAPKHIGLVAVGGAAWMGGANYVRNLGAAIREASPEVSVSYLVGEPIAAEWKDAQPQKVVSNANFLRRMVRGTNTLAGAVRDSGVEFVYPLTYDNDYNLGLRWPAGPALAGADWAGWVPDFQHRHLPDFFSAEEIQRRDESIARLVEEAPRVVFSSESAAEDFRRFYPKHSAKAVVWRFAVPPPKLEDEPCEAPARFFLVCNQFWAHKNHIVIFKALRLLRERGVQPLVLCTGQLDDYRDRSFGDTIRAALDGLGEQVTLLGLLPRARQLALMRRALAIIQPSRFEGWSTVVEDCRALGRPTLLSDLAVHREQNPPGARYFDPQSAEAFAELMAEAWRDWPAGPDLAAEQNAQAVARETFVEAGRRFLATVARPA